MITQAVDPHHFIRRARQIKALIPNLLSQWGLLPKFKRWRLAQDPGNGMVVLFGVLDTKYIATHTTTPFSDYFDARLMRDLASELKVQVISSSNDGLRYAFVLEKGFSDSPAYMTGLHPQETAEVIDLRSGGGQSVPHRIKMGRIEKRSAARPPHTFVLTDDVTVTHQRLARFLKITDALEAANGASAQPISDVLLMDQAEFNRRMTDYENGRRQVQ
jgi:hypothetical protein